MSPELKHFLEDWLAWVEAGAPEGQPFTRSMGLCNHTPSRAVHNELKALFAAQGLDEVEPFGTDYMKRACNETQHLCPNRIAWVQRQLGRGESGICGVGEFYVVAALFFLIVLAFGAAL